MTVVDTIPRSKIGRPTAIALAIGVTLAVNLLLWLVGSAAGGSFEMTDAAGRTTSAAPTGVVVLTVVPMSIGLSAAALLSLRWPRVIPIAQIIGAVLAVATIGLTLATDFDAPSMTMLSMMHITVAAGVVFALGTIRR